MRRAILRSVVVAIGALSIGLVADLIHLEWLCPEHRVWQRVHDGRTTVIRDSGYALARPGDATYACTTTHMTGPIAWHLDLECYCAPSSMGTEALGTRLGGQCVVDQPTPLPTDEVGACLHARCDKHVDF